VISSVADVFQLAVICVLIVFSGVFSGLNLGLMSLTLNDLTVCVVCLCCSISLSLSL
jgi:CBS domain containing-hemolysin-like protein